MTSNSTNSTKSSKSSTKSIVPSVPSDPSDPSDPSEDALDLLRGAEDALSAMTSRMQSMSRKLLDLVGVASEGKAREKELKSQLSAAHKNVARTHAELSTLEREREAEAAVLQNNQEEIAALHRQQEDVAARLADAVHELQDARHELQDARAELQETRDVLQERKDEILRMNNDCADLRASASAALEEAARCRDELSRETERATELEALNAGLKSVSRMVSLQNENERLREELRALGAGPAGRLRARDSSSYSSSSFAKGLTSQPSA